MKTSIKYALIALFCGSLLLMSCEEDEVLNTELSSSPLMSANDSAVQASISSSEVMTLSFEDNNLTSNEGDTPWEASNLSFTEGIIGQGICFGRTDVLQYPAAGNISYEKGSASMWVKPNWAAGDGNLYKLLYYGAAPVSPKHFEMHIDEHGLIALGMNSASMNGQDIRVAYGDATPWAPGSWHHITYTWDSEAIRVYVDGVLAEETPVGYEIPSVPDNHFHIGSLNGYEGFDGVLDEIKIYREVLTQEEVQWQYDNFLRDHVVDLQPGISQCEVIDSVAHTSCEATEIFGPIEDILLISDGCSDCEQDSVKVQINDRITSLQNRIIYVQDEFRNMGRPANAMQVGFEVTDSLHVVCARYWEEESCSMDNHQIQVLQSVTELFYDKYQQILNCPGPDGQWSPWQNVLHNGEWYRAFSARQSFDQASGFITEGEGTAISWVRTDDELNMTQNAWRPAPNALNPFNWEPEIRLFQFYPQGGGEIKWGPNADDIQFSASWTSDGRGEWKTFADGVETASGSF